MKTLNSLSLSLMSTMVRKWHHSLFSLVVMFLFSAISLFSQTNDTTMCNTIQGCGNWEYNVVSVPIKFPNPQPPPSPPFLDCDVTVHYYKRVCPGGVVQIQPIRIHLTRENDCNFLFAQFIFAYNTQDWAEHQRLGEQLWEDVIGDFFLEAVFEEEYKNSGFDNSYVCPNTKTYKVSQPSCKGLCISYWKSTFTADISAVQITWMSCGTSCCESTYSICYNTSLQRVVKALVSVTKTGTCDENSSVDPNDHCTSNGGFVAKFIPYECKDYCEPTSGILKSSDKTDKVYDVQNSIVRTNLLFDENTIIENIVVTSNTIRFQKRNDLKFIRILDLSGQLIREMDISKLEERSYFTMNVTDLSNGMYQLQIVSEISVTKQLLIHK